MANTEPDVDPVRAFLDRRGCPRFIIEEGLAGLVTRYEAFVDEVEATYRTTFDEYKNDADGRQILEEVRAWWDDDAKKRVTAADARLNPLLVSARKCIWGQQRAGDRRWTRTKNWWYYKLPKKRGGRFRYETNEM